MLIRLTQKLTVCEREIARFCKSPYDSAAMQMKEQAERAAAETWISRCGQMNTVIESLPVEVKAMLPTGNNLLIVDNTENNHTRCIELPRHYVRLNGIITVSRWDDNVPSNGPAGLPPSLADVLEANREAYVKWDEGETMRRKGAMFDEAIKEHLRPLDITTAEQFIWSCKPLSDLIYTINQEATDRYFGGARRYYRSRRYDGMEILVDIVRERRTLTRDKMRRPRRTFPFPDSLATLCGEAQVIQQALPKKKK